MTRFVGGPADGRVLCLQRSPRFLRVVINASGDVDALDQQQDEVRDGETVHVYVLERNDGWVHVKRTGGSGMFQSAMYQWFPRCAPQGVLKNNALWRGWATEQDLKVRARKTAGNHGG